MSDAPERRTIGGRILHRLARLLSPLRAIRLRIRLPSPARLLGFRKRPYARPAILYLTDARNASDPLRVRGVPPEESRLARFRLGTIIAGLVTIFILGLVVSIFGTHGYRDVLEIRAELLDFQDRVDIQQEKVVVLRGEVQSLKEDPYTIERIAREQLGYAKEGEITFLLPHEDEDRTAGTRPAAARKEAVIQPEKRDARAGGRGGRQPG